jgi:AcrR family transcriptional regulator
MDQRVTQTSGEMGRRSPRQARAKEMIATILEATADILEDGGVEALNTNHIAVRAGVSVGAVYQYFPNKAAILLMLGRREMEAVRHAARAALDAPAVWPAPSPDRAAIRALLRTYDQWLKSKRAVVRAVLLHLDPAELAAPVEETVSAIALAGGDRLSGPGAQPSALQMFVATRALMGAVRAAVLEDQSFLRSPEFEDALVTLIRNYLHND